MNGLPALSVLSLGAVSPAGFTASSLMDSAPTPTQEPWLSQPEKMTSLYRISPVSECLIKWQKEPRLRRASPLALFLMDAAAQALAEHPALNRERLGLVCALGTGSINYSRRFYQESMNRGRKFASPALFPETVYNSPVSHIAAILGIQEACYSLIGDESSWVEALRVAQVWLALNKVDTVLILAGEELDAVSIEAFHITGWIRRGVIPSEGAGALLVKKKEASDLPMMQIEPNPVTHAFRSQASQKEAWNRFLSNTAEEKNNRLPGNIVSNLLTKQWSPHFERSGPDLGAAFTASAAWATIQMLLAQQSGSLLVPGSNCGVSQLRFIRPDS